MVFRKGQKNQRRGTVCDGGIRAHLYSGPCLWGRARMIGESSNGRTNASGAFDSGSNPFSPANTCIDKWPSRWLANLLPLVRFQLQVNAPVV